MGIGTFFCALGVMHFLETYLASILYVPLPFGIVASPGSTVLFTGKLMLLLLVYIREDAVVVRQPIYGLLLGNVLLLALAALMRLHGAGVLEGHAADFGFLDEMGALMVWGTLVLFADCIMMILLYERLRPIAGRSRLLRLWLTGALILTFDQGAFFGGLHYLTGAPLSVLFGGWAAKMAAVAIYAALGAIYLRFVELPRRTNKRPPRLGDVFDLLTYRERYEDLMASSGRDALTGALDRGRLEREGRNRVAAAALSGRPLSLLILDIDHFKSFNDRFGHTAGDVVLLRIARIVMRTVGVEDAVFRFGGEEFVVIVPDMSRPAAHDARRAHSPRCREPHGCRSRHAACHCLHRPCHLRGRRLRLRRPVRMRRPAALSRQIGGKKSRHRPQRRKPRGLPDAAGDAGVTHRACTNILVTTGLDPVVHAEVRIERPLDKSEWAFRPHGLPGDLASRRRRAPFVRR